MNFVPTLKVVVANIATPPVRVVVPRFAVPFLKVTLPAGVPHDDETVAVNITDSPNVDGLRDEVRTTALVPGFTT
jgi:hypothetical protein